MSRPSAVDSAGARTITARCAVNCAPNKRPTALARNHSPGGPSPATVPVALASSANVISCLTSQERRFYRSTSGPGAACSRGSRSRRGTPRPSRSSEDTSLGHEGPEHSPHRRRPAERRPGLVRNPYSRRDCTQAACRSVASDNSRARRRCMHSPEGSSRRRRMHARRRR